MKLAEKPAPRCARCVRTEKLTRSHVPSRFVCRRVWGSLNKAFKAGKYQVHWLCEDCRRKHQALEEQLMQKKMLELAEELRELHARFCAQSVT